MSGKRKQRPFEKHIRLGVGLQKRLSLICVLRQEATQAGYIRLLIERGIEQDMRAFPSALLQMRPDSVIYSMEGTGNARVFTPVSRTQGGERCWMLSPVGILPRTFGGGYAYLVDITVVGTNPGADFRGVVVESTSIIGA